MAELQTIPARHGVATFVPAGQTIKIINTSGTQVVDTWAFALPAPDAKSTPQEGDDEEVGKEEKKEVKKPEPKSTPKATPKKLNKKNDLPSQEDAEAATKEAMEKGEQATDATPQKSGWGSYVPSVPTLGLGGGKKDSPAKGESEQQKNSRTWASYFPSGKGVSSYIPKQASDTVSQFGSMHARDTSKSYLQQLQDFSRTPVGAAGLSVMTGSGYSGSLMAGYQAWNASNAKDAPAMEFMSMPHCRASTLHMVPRVNDTLVTNLREPILTLLEDTGPGVHDTLIAACDPQRYKELGVSKWEEHESCAANLVLALKELNERAGLKGAKAVGADVTINNVPAPLNLFMNIPWDNDGEVGFKEPKAQKGDYVRFKALRDVVVVMSACPQDVLDINAKNPTDANFIVEEGEAPAKALRRTTPAAAKKKPIAKKAPAKPSADDAKSTVSSASAAPKKKPLPPKVQPSKKPAAAASKAPTSSSSSSAAAPKKNPPPTSKPPVKKPAAAAASTNGDSVAGEKKKPRKLPARPKPAAASS